MVKRYRLTPKRAAALKKAQAASAKKRKGRGKAKPAKRYHRVAVNSAAAKKRVVKRRGTAVNSRRRKVYRRTAIGAAAALGTGALVYRNRENLIIKHMAVHRAVKDHKRNYANLGIPMTKDDIAYIKAQERIDHANRSTLRVREYREARGKARAAYARGRSLRPDRKNSVWSLGMGVHRVPTAKHNYYYETYRKDVHSRAQARLARMKGKKRKFGYDSGKRLTVYGGGRVKREFW